MRSMLYRLNLSMSGGALYCIEESQYGEVHAVQLNLSMSGGALYCKEESLYNKVEAVQAELVHVWRGLVLYRGVTVQ